MKSLSEFSFASLFVGLLFLGAACSQQPVAPEPQSSESLGQLPVTQDRLGSSNTIDPVEEETSSAPSTTEPQDLPDEPSQEPTTPPAQETTPEPEPEPEPEPQAPAPAVKSFTIVARQWEFSPSVITVNEGDQVKISITSEDVTHGFALSAFGVTRTLQAGQTEVIEFTADKKGSFNFFCSVFCGSGHGGMKGTLIVQ